MARVRKRLAPTGVGLQPGREPLRGRRGRRAGACLYHAQGDLDAASRGQAIELLVALREPIGKG